MSIMIEDLAKADQQVALAERHVEAQQEVVALMRTAGASTDGAEKLLAQFKSIANHHLRHRDQIAEQSTEPAIAKAA